MSASILVVDDDPDVADLFRQRFRREARGYRDYPSEDARLGDGTEGQEYAKKYAIRTYI